MEKVIRFNSELEAKKITLCCAESVTAGLLASTIAAVPGASSVLKGSIVTYSRELKTSILHVHPKIIDEFSAESIETTVEMVYGLVKLYPSAKLYIAVTGVATEGKENSDVIKKLGQVFIAIYYNKELVKIEETIKTIKTDEVEIRNEIREKTVELIFETILQTLNKH